MAEIDSNKITFYFRDQIHLTVDGLDVVAKNIDFFYNTN
jgi:hypothetical protein